jgi:cell division protein FtsN
VAKRGARRTTQQSSSAGWIGFGMGLVVGLGLATLVGVMRGPDPAGQTQVVQDEGLTPLNEEIAPARRYDFFSVLPEVERVVPEQEIAERMADQAGEPTRTYRLQVGSFKSQADAEALKAQITLLGLSAEVQTVSVDEETWHRVRVGPFDSARAADGARRRLQENGLEALVLSGQ